MMSDMLRGLHTSHSLSPLTNHVILSVYGPGRICSEARSVGMDKGGRGVYRHSRHSPFGVFLPAAEQMLPGRTPSA